MKKDNNNDIILKNRIFTDNELLKPFTNLDQNTQFCSDDIFFYSELSNYYKRHQKYDKAMEAIQIAYSISLNIFGKYDITTGQIARKLASHYLQKKDLKNSIKFYEKSYTIFDKNELYLSLIMSSTFKQLVSLYIQTNSRLKLQKLFLNRQRTLIKKNARLYEIIEALIQMGDIEDAYLTTIDEFDSIYTHNGKNYNYFALAKLFEKLGDKTNALKCLQYTQQYFIKMHNKKSTKVEQMIIKIHNYL